MSQRTWQEGYFRCAVSPQDTVGVGLVADMAGLGYASRAGQIYWDPRFFAMSDFNNSRSAGS
jgi:hypothetical protein